MILMIAPASGMTFGAMPSGASYVSDPFALVRIFNDSSADQTALEGAGCFTLTPFGNWGNAGFVTLADLYAADTGSILPGITGYPIHTVATVFTDPTLANCGTWAKTTTGNGSGAWTQVSTETLASIATTAGAAATSAATAATTASAAAAAAGTSAATASGAATTATTEAGIATTAAGSASASATAAANAAAAGTGGQVFTTHAAFAAALSGLGNANYQVIADETHGGDWTIYSVASHAATFLIDLSPGGMSEPQLTSLFNAMQAAGLFANFQGI